jgi:NitT/TauT family transport system ATP-binding protein
MYLPKRFTTLPKTSHASGGPEPGTQPDRAGVPDGARQPRLLLDNIRVDFNAQHGPVEALAGISLRIEPGEFVCIVGPSGCGKSTLVGVIAGFVRPSRGTVLMDGMPVKGAGPNRAVIFQEAALFPWLSAVQNVEFALKHVRDRRERRRRAMRHLEMVHLSRFAHAHPHELSGGMRQRVAIARALALEPEVLLMDEPFAALDAHTRDLLIQEVQRIWQETRQTVLMVTHNVLEAVTLADRVICMATRPGRIKQDIRIDLPRPREVESPETSRIAQLILAGLRDSFASSHENAPSVPGARPTGRAIDYSDYTSGLMGDGI